jgi:translation elongation factor EF-1alpha
MIILVEERIGSVIKFFDKTSIAAVKLDFGDLAMGDSIHVKGHDTDFTQKIEDLEFDHHPVEKAIRGQFIGIKLSQTAKPFDLVYKVTG